MSFGLDSFFILYDGIIANTSIFNIGVFSSICWIEKAKIERIWERRESLSRNKLRWLSGGIAIKVLG